MQIIEQLPEQYQTNITRAVEILKQGGCTEVFLFGSLASGNFNPRSDIDLAVRGCPPGNFFHLLGQLIAAGGYHHHMGLNTWAGVGAPPADAARLHWFEIRLPDQAALDPVVDRLQAAKVAFQRQDNLVVVNDPAQNQIHLVVASLG